jgi:hypothetical protein
MYEACGELLKLYNKHNVGKKVFANLELFDLYHSPRQAGRKNGWQDRRTTGRKIQRKGKGEKGETKIKKSKRKEGRTKEQQEKR